MLSSNLASDLDVQASRIGLSAKQNDETVEFGQVVPRLGDQMLHVRGWLLHVLIGFSWLDRFKTSKHFNYLNKKSPDD